MEAGKYPIIPETYNQLVIDQAADNQKIQQQEQEAKATESVV